MGFLMRCPFALERTVFLELNTPRVLLLVLGSRVVALLARLAL